MKQIDNIKQYIRYLILAVIIIFIYKNFNGDLFEAIFNAFLPVIIGGVLAYFLQPLVYVLEMKIDSISDGKYEKISHTVSSIVIFVIFVLIIIALLMLIMPALVNYVVHISGNITSYTSSYEKTILDTFGANIFSQTVINCGKTLIENLSSIEAVNPMDTIDKVFQAGSTILTIVIGLIFTPYCLIEAKNLVSIFDRVCSLFMSDDTIAFIHGYAFKAHHIFGRFIYGKFLDSLIIGIIAFIGLAALKIKYFPLLAAFILITNMIPYFGPFIGGVPAVLVALITGDLISALSTLLFVFVLQQFDGLFLGPKILGDVVGISPFWVLFSITVFGSFFGFIGMFLGVPLICVIRMFFNDFIEYRKEKATE